MNLFFRKPLTAAAALILILSIQPPSAHAAQLDCRSTETQALQELSSARLHQAQLRLQAAQDELQSLEDLRGGVTGAKARALAASILAGIDLAIGASLVAAPVGAIAAGGVLGPFGGAEEAMLAFGIGGGALTLGAVPVIASRGASFDEQAIIRAGDVYTQTSAADVFKLFDHAREATIDAVNAALGKIERSGRLGNDATLGWHTVGYLDAQITGEKALMELDQKEIRFAEQLLGGIRSSCASEQR